MTDTSVPTQRFVYDELPDHSIRLLEIIKQESEPHGFSFRMRTYQLETAPIFNALSYVWGDPPNFQPVLCHSDQDSSSGVLEITSNLLNALPFLSTASDKPIWIDAVCINQGNKAETKKVVPMMGDYYSKAAEVLIWLGPSADGSDLAMDVISWMWFPQQRELLQRSLCGATGSLEPSQLTAILSVLSNGVLITDPANDVATLGIPDLEHALWSALPSLYQRPWFSRVWTFPEIMLAKTARALCGDRSIPWPALQQLGDRLSDTQLTWIARPTGQDQFSALRDLQFPHRNGEWFWIYLQGAQDRQCLFKEDRVYGLLALAPQSIRDKIEVVYDEHDPNHYVQTYRDAAVAFLGELPLETVLTAAPSPNKAAAMPSWCPDWSQRAISNAPPARFKADAAHLALQSWSVDPLDRNVLQIHGQQIDVVKSVIDDYSYHWPNGVSGIGGPAHKMLQWLERCEALARETFGSEEDALEAHWKTLTAHSDTHNQFNFPAEPIRGLAAQRRRLAENRDSVPIAETALSQEDLQALGPLLAYVGVLWPGKVFFATEKGTVGIADKGIAAGDAVCFFYGACKHFVLRDLGGGTHSLNSVAYVHGMMGDVAAALRVRDGEKTPEHSARMFRIR